MDLEKEDREQKKAEETGSTEVNNAFLTDPSTNKGVFLFFIVRLSYFNPLGFIFWARL